MDETERIELQIELPNELDVKLREMPQEELTAILRKVESDAEELGVVINRMKNIIMQKKFSRMSPPRLKEIAGENFRASGLGRRKFTNALVILQEKRPGTYYEEFCDSLYTPLQTADEVFGEG